MGLKCIISLLSAEFLLNKHYFHNGGVVILLRATWISLLVAGFTYLMINSDNLCHIVDDKQISPETKKELFQWLGVIFGATYAALYARFSSQWTYLANLYNKIKEYELDKIISQIDITQRGSHSQKLAEIKAGFIDDASILHLTTKKSFVYAINKWGKEDDVNMSFSLGDKDEEIKLKSILERVRKVCENKKDPDSGINLFLYALFIFYCVILYSPLIEVANYLYFLLKSMCI